MQGQLTSAWIVLDQELIQSDPAASNTDHDSRSEDAHQPKLLGLAKSVLPFTNFVDAELRAASALGGLTLHLVIDTLHFSAGLGLEKKRFDE